MEKISVKFNDLHDALLRIPGHYGKTKKGDIIEVSKKVWESELKTQKNLNGEDMFPLHVEEKPKPKKEQKEIEIEQTE